MCFPALSTHFCQRVFVSSRFPGVQFLPCRPHSDPSGLNSLSLDFRWPRGGGPCPRWGWGDPTEGLGAKRQHDPDQGLKENTPFAKFFKMTSEAESWGEMLFFCSAQRKCRMLAESSVPGFRPGPVTGELCDLRQVAAYLWFSDAPATSWGVKF